MRVNRDKTWRKNIQISMLVKRLYDNAQGALKTPQGKSIELTAGQLKSIEILLKKLVPDLKAIAHTGKDGGAIQNNLTVRYVDGKDEA